MGQPLWQSTYGLGQSLGKLKDRYIHFGEGADQLCGRMIAGLPFDSERFGVLPPHFPPEVLSKMTMSYWSEIVSGYGNYPRGVQSAFPFLMAFIIHHGDYLRRILSSSHPIFKARVFTANSLLDIQRGATILAIGTSPVCGLKATGIPAHLPIAKQVNGLQDEVANLHKEIANLKAEMAETLPNTVTVTVVSELRQHFVVNGIAPISLRDLDTRISDLRSSIATEFQSVLNGMQLAKSTPITSSSHGQQPEWQTWVWNDGQLCHAVPKDREFPAQVNVKAIWNLWYFGDRDSKIRSYRLLSKKRDISPSHRMRHSRVSVVMKYLERLAEENNVFPNGVTRIAALPISEADKVFDDVFTTMLSELYTTKPNTAEELSCGTLYSRICRNRRE